MVRLLKNNSGFKQYYKMYSEKILSLEQKNKIINKVFSLKNGLNQNLYNEIKEKTENRNFNKKTTDDLNDIESTILETLGSFILSYTDDYGILSNDDLTRIQNIELRNTEKEKKKRFFEEKKPPSKMQIKRWKKSKTYRLNALFSYNNTLKYDEDGSYIENTFYKQPGQYKYKRNGIIDSNKPYEKKWCIIDSNNTFHFKNNTYFIDNVKQYGKKVRHQNLDDYKNIFSMDKILVLEQDSNVYYFDMNINRINNDNIIKIKL